MAIGDLHGDLSAARTALRLAGAIDSTDTWIGGDLVEKTRREMTDFFGGTDPERLCFAYNASDALNLLVFGLVSVVFLLVGNLGAPETGEATEILARYWSRRVAWVATNGLRDLRRREADIALRSVRPSAPDLFARKLGDETARLYAAASYLARHGEPRSAEDLAGAEFLGFDHDLDGPRAHPGQGRGALTQLPSVGNPTVPREDGPASVPLQIRLLGEPPPLQSGVSARNS